MRPLALAALLAVVLGCCTVALQRPHVEPSPPPLPEAVAPVPPAPAPVKSTAPTSPTSTEKALDLAKWHLNYAHGVLREHTLEDDSHHD